MLMRLFTPDSIKRLLRIALILATGTRAVAVQDADVPLLSPTGNWRVGRATLELIDSGRRMPDGGPHRLFVQV